MKDLTTFLGQQEAYEPELEESVAHLLKVNSCILGGVRH